MATEEQVHRFEASIWGGPRGDSLTSTRRGLITAKLRQILFLFSFI